MKGAKKIRSSAGKEAEMTHPRCGQGFKEGAVNSETAIHSWLV